MRLRFQFKGGVLLFSCIILTPPVMGGNFFIGNTYEVDHSRGSKGVFIEYRPKKIGGHIHTWGNSRKTQEGANLALSVDYLYPFKKWRVGGGLVYIKYKTKQTGTNLNFTLQADYALNRKWDIFYIHYSHGASFGISKDKANSGFNFIGIKRKF